MYRFFAFPPSQQENKALLILTFYDSFGTSDIYTDDSRCMQIFFLLLHVLFRSRFLLLRSSPDTNVCHLSLLWLISILASLHQRLALWQWKQHTTSVAGSSPTPAAGHYLPGNPLPYLAPSATHQPELLLLSWMIATLRTLVTNRTIPSSLNQQAYGPYLQLRNTLRHLVTITTDLCQGISILQFLPASRATTNFLSSPIPPPTRPPTAIPPQHRLITHLTPRARSRSRDRPSTTTTITTTTTPTTPVNTVAPDRRPFTDITNAHSHRSSLHQSLWTATSTTSSSPSSGTWPLHSGPDYTGSSR